MQCSCEYRTYGYQWHTREGVPCGITLYKVIHSRNDISAEKIHDLARQETAIQQREHREFFRYWHDCHKNVETIPSGRLDKVFAAAGCAYLISHVADMGWVVKIAATIGAWIGSYAVVWAANRIWPCTKADREAELAKVLQKVIDARVARFDSYKLKAPGYRQTAISRRSDREQHDHLLQLAKNKGSSLRARSVLHRGETLSYENVKKRLDDAYGTFFPFSLLPNSGALGHYQSELQCLQFQFDTYILKGGVSAESEELPFEFDRGLLMG